MLPLITGALAMEELQAAIQLCCISIIIQETMLYTLWEAQLVGVLILHGIRFMLHQEYIYRTYLPLTVTDRMMYFILLPAGWRITALKYSTVGDNVYLLLILLI